MAWHTRAIEKYDCSVGFCKKAATVWLHNPVNARVGTYCRKHGEDTAKARNEEAGLQ